MDEENSIDLVPISEGDLAFLRRVYGSTREEELAAVPWSASQREGFLDMQFNAQHQYYRAQFPDAEFNIIQYKGEKVGRWYVDHRTDEIRIVDIALLPTFRRKGIGSRLMADVLDRADREGKCVGIHVEKNNPALKWYQSLGFKEISDQGVYLLMNRPPKGA